MHNFKVPASVSLTPRFNEGLHERCRLQPFPTVSVPNYPVAGGPLRKPLKRLEAAFTPANPSLKRGVNEIKRRPLRKWDAAAAWLTLFTVWAGTFLASCGPVAFAQAPVVSPSAPNPPLRQIGPDVFQLGKVRLDKGRKTVQFTAILNMNSGLIEYLLVNARGKTYESLLRTETDPYEIQLAMLLIGASGAPQTPALLASPSAPFHVNAAGGTNSPPPLVPSGDRILIELAWTAAGQEKHARGEDWVWNLAAKTNAAAGSWIYNGSRVVKGTFIAQRDGSVVAMIDDIDAMVNNPRAGHDNDQIWQIKTNDLPPLETPVEVTFRLERLENPSK